MKIYDSLTQEKQELNLVNNTIKLYVCGVTVYNYCHIGHARVFVVFDSLVRYLRSKDITVIYARNITDIDDKIINKAIIEQKSIDTITEYYIKAMRKDFSNLDLLEPDFEPQATDHMPQMINLVQKLIDNGYAYIGENHDVYFKVKQFAEYGALSKRDIDDLQAGARVSLDEYKHDPLDFVLWKAPKEHEPSWQAPWGKGRPGWHLECAAMSVDCLGENFDLHGGGCDLMFPHHENEIAEAKAAGLKFARLWMHVGFLEINKEKMSKSLDNFILIREVLSLYHPEVFRYFVLSSHYQSPIEFSWQQLDSAKSALERLYIALRDLPQNHHDISTDDYEHELKERYQKKFTDALDDDFNTAEALAVLFDLAKEINKEKSLNIKLAKILAHILKQLGQSIGILCSGSYEFLQYKPARMENNTQDLIIEELIVLRDNARRVRDWKQADSLREKLNNLGIELEDTPSKTLWRRK